jgi:hypothetical protein
VLLFLFEIIILSDSYVNKCFIVLGQQYQEGCSNPLLVAYSLYIIIVCLFLDGWLALFSDSMREEKGLVLMQSFGNARSYHLCGESLWK